MDRCLDDRRLVNAGVPAGGWSSGLGKSCIVGEPENFWGRTYYPYLPLAVRAIPRRL